MKHLPALALGLLLAACSAEDGVPGVAQAGDCPIGFSTTVEETVTRSNDLNTANLLSVGVFAYYTGGNNWTTSDLPNFMYNQPVTRTGSTAPWTYSPLKYWPNNPADKLSFMAYAPYVKEAVGSNPSFSGITAGGYPSLGYTVPATDNEQKDLLVAVPLMDRTYATDNGKVSFTMEHALTRVTVFVKSNDNVAGKKLTDFSIQAVKKGTMTFRTPTADNAKCLGWTFGTPVEMIAVKPFNPSGTTFPFAVPAVKDEKKQLADFFLLPATGTAHKFSITYTTAGTAGNGQSAPVQTVTLTDQPLPSMDKWGIGAYVSYTFAIEKQKLTVTTSVHPTWSDAGTGTVTGSVVITYTENGTFPNWGNGGSGSVDGVPVTTHIEQGDVLWEDGGSDIVVVN